MIKIPSNWLSNAADVQAFVDEIFPDLEHNHQHYSGRAILTPKNQDVDIINEIILDEISRSKTTTKKKH